MTTQRVAGVDVGSNSFLLTILEAGADGERVRLDRTDIVKLGQGVDQTGHLAPAAIERAAAKLGEYQQVCAEYGVQRVRAVGTAALRDAVDREVLLDRVERETGWRIEVISGEQEAELTYADVSRSHGRPEVPLNLLDIGGGSTEVVSGCGGHIAARRSVNIGSRRLWERARPGDPLSAEDLARCRQVAAEALGPIAAPPADLAGSGGTITTLAAIHLGLTHYDASRISQVRLRADEVTAQVVRLAALPLAARRQLPGLEPDRADIITTGAVLLEQAMQRLQAEVVHVCAGGLRLAVARSLLDTDDA